MKKCIKCGIEKPLSEFPKRKNSKDGHRNSCKECRLTYQRKWSNGEIEKKDYSAPEGMKKCRKCEKILSVDNFGKSNKNKDGLKSHCKECKRQESKYWRDNNQEHCKKYREDHKDEIREKDRKYRTNNKEKIKKVKQQYVEDHKEDVAARKKKWYEENKDSVIEKKRDRRRNNINVRIAEGLRTRLRRALKNNTKRGSAVKDLGCSLDFFRKYMETKFAEGMSWENHGEWHIDHIIPLSSFDLTDRKQLLEACHYTNLQPLWAEDNLRKGARVPSRNKGE
jgi:hypothetical protein